ncbi:mitochondrial carrier protein [Histoplasma capsulatum var. duboisii H88]|uniref:Mitochondrial carrier protein n=1 Tax=Ajellomyces capsulatus (strain H88) TaxID=544711 RepID=F0UDS7_AJEC8|nr:mitochondrial carrier protein [Histoplasma capsulatum var. duboisii H88]
MSTTAGAFIAGGLAACGAVTVTHSFETVKIRLQLQGELQSKREAVRKYRGVFHGVKVILQNEGARGLFRGIGSAYIYQVLLNGCRLGFYEPLRVNITQAIYKDSTHQSLGINVFSGAASGVLGAAAGSPFFLVKTRLQSFSPFLPVGTQHKYRNSFDGLRQIYMGEGVKGLYRGVYAAMVRTGFGSSVQLPTYFFAKRRLIKHLGMEDGPALHLASSTCSGFVVCCVMHPPDTIMSRMYNQTGNLYKGVFDCLYKTISTEGVLAIYKGYFAHLARILPHTYNSLDGDSSDFISDLEHRLGNSEIFPFRRNIPLFEKKADTMLRSGSSTARTVASKSQFPYGKFLKSENSEFLGFFSSRHQQFAVPCYTNISINPDSRSNVLGNYCKIKKNLRWLPKERVYAVCSGGPYLRGTVYGHLRKENGGESAIVLSYAVEESVEVLERHRPDQSYWYNDESQMFHGWTSGFLFRNPAQETERKLGIKLPADYEEFLSIMNGFEQSWGGIVLDSPLHPTTRIIYQSRTRASEVRARQIAKGWESNRDRQPLADSSLEDPGRPISAGVMEMGNMTMS